MLVYAFWTLFQWGGPENVALISDLAYLPVSLFATLAAWRVAASQQLGSRLRLAWLILGFSILSQFIADLIWFYFEIVLEIAPFPSLADVFYLLFYPLTLWGLLTMPVSPLTWNERLRFLIDLMIVLIGAWTAVWYFVLSPIAASTASDRLSQVLTAAYPIGELVLVGGVVSLLLRRPPPSTLAALLIVLGGLTLYIVADLIFGYQSLGGMYRSGGWLDIG